MNRRSFLVRAGATAAVSRIPAPFLALGQSPSGGNAHVPLLFGTDYYPDQTPASLWEEDAQRMAEFGITNVRIAEFAWALTEPSPGKFDFAWLKRAIEILHRRGIAVILGTPSAAPPTWLTAAHPEVLLVNQNDVTLTPGSRRFTCPTNATYRQLSLKIATEMAQTFAASPGVVGWQIDNELTLSDFPRCYCRYCRVGFQAWLKARYGSLAAVNAAWGTVFWSNTYTDFAQIETPLPTGAPHNPGLALDYDRYQSDANVSFLEEQLTMLRRLCPAHFITTNNVAGLADTINPRDLYRKLDFVSSDNYPGFVAAVINGDLGTSIPAEYIAPTISLGHDFSRSAKDGKPFLIMEEQSGKAGQPIFSPQPQPGQIRLWTYQAVAHGAMGINYFRWDTADFAAEEYWHGILRHDRTPSPAFEEMRTTLRELKSLPREDLHAPYVADLALCFDFSSDWALTIQPGQPKLKYIPECVSWYTAAGPHGGIDIVDCTGDLARYRVVLAPALYVVSAGQAERIRAFVQGGGTFIAGVRLGVKTEQSQIVRTPLPGLLRDVMGVELLDYQPIYSEKQGVRFTGALEGPEAECRVWADILDPRGADTWATYTAGAYSGKAAITSHAFGKGRAIYMGAHFEDAALARVLTAMLSEAGVHAAARPPFGVEVCRRRSSLGTLTYYLNHLSTPQTVSLSGSAKDVLADSNVTGTVTLDPYGVRVLRTT